MKKPSGKVKPIFAVLGIAVITFLIIWGLAALKGLLINGI